MSSVTESVESVQSLEATVDLEIVLAALKEFGCADLFKVIKMSTQEAEKRVKSGSKVKKEDGPKKPTPHQLQKPTAWVRFTLKHAQERGFTGALGADERGPASARYLEGRVMEGDRAVEAGGGGELLGRDGDAWASALLLLRVGYRG